MKSRSAQRDMFLHISAQAGAGCNQLPLTGQLHRFAEAAGLFNGRH